VDAAPTREGALASFVVFDVAVFVVFDVVFDVVAFVVFDVVFDVAAFVVFDVVARLSSSASCSPPQFDTPVPHPTEVCFGFLVLVLSAPLFAFTIRCAQGAFLSMFILLFDSVFPNHQCNQDVAPKKTIGNCKNFFVFRSLTTEGKLAQCSLSLFDLTYKDFFSLVVVAFPIRSLSCFSVTLMGQFVGIGAGNHCHSGGLAQLQSFDFSMHARRANCWFQILVHDAHWISMDCPTIGLQD